MTTNEAKRKYPHLSRVFKVGERLEDPYYEWVSNPLYAHIIHRVCNTCGFGWPTSEVPLHWGWKGAAADFCPSHINYGQAIMSVSPRQAMKRDGKDVTGGILHVIGMGGVYRRRQCMMCMNCGHSKTRHEGKPCSKQYKHQYGTKDCCGCEDFSPCLNPQDGKLTRWSTGEFNADGIVVQDVSLCSVCGDVGRKVTEGHKQRGGRIQGARMRLAKFRMRERAREGHDGLKGPESPD